MAPPEAKVSSHLDIDDENPKPTRVGARSPVSELESPRLATATLSESQRHIQTLLLLGMVAAIEGADMQLLPATYHALEADMGFTPWRLGRMSLAQSLFTALASPVWGYFADRQPRKYLLVMSCCLWGVLTLLLSAASTFETIFLLRCLHGCTLAALTPIAATIVADIAGPTSRGTYFGFVQFSMCSGQICASVISTTIAEQIFFSSVKGWRLAFCVVGLISLLAGWIIYTFLEESPRYSQHEVLGTSCVRRFRGVCAAETARVCAFLRVPTFAVIVLQGVFGSIPWNAMSFMTMYLQYCGHNSAEAAFVASGVLMGKAVGGIIGGMIGDAMASYSPNHGRPCVAQLSVLGGVPIVLALVLSAPYATPTKLFAIAFSLGLVASWTGSGVNRPILVEIVDPVGRASVISWLVAMEGTSSAFFGAPIVGILSELVFGYQQIQTADPLGESIARDRNMNALGKAMIWGTLPPWILCGIVYSVLHWSYPRDLQRARSVYKVWDFVPDPP